ncbi:MAG: hypothetical protein FWD45_05850 [Coriobacteriia bacterium]|nr:hypothetical protein [Coriobacteriia bacterium]
MNAETKEQVQKFNKARSNLALVVVFSMLNTLLTAIDTGLSFPFSATTPQVAFIFGEVFAQEFRNNVFISVGLVVAAIIIGLFFVCWILSNRWRVFILVAFILFCLDSLVLGFLALGVDNISSFILDIAFHFWVLYCLIIGVVAWANLRGVSEHEFTTALQGASSMTEINPVNGMSQQCESAGYYPTYYESVALRADDKKGRILISANYEHLQISMKRTRGLTELIVNGAVYDEITGIFETGYSLTANVQSVRIVGTFKPTDSHMYLYANDVLLAKKLRLY